MDNIGKVLRQARIDQGMTIDDLQKKTRIQKRYLIAIENGDFDQLPGQFYVRAFIKQYGENVGIDTESYFKTVEKTEQSDDSVKQVKEEEEQTPSNLNAENRSSYLTRQQPENRWHSLIPQILVIAAVILVVFIDVLILVLQVFRKKEKLRVLKVVQFLKCAVVKALVLKRHLAVSQVWCLKAKVFLVQSHQKKSLLKVLL